jgi:hypothetical protein
MSTSTITGYAVLRDPRLNKGTTHSAMVLLNDVIEIFR